MLRPPGRLGRLGCCRLAGRSFPRTGGVLRLANAASRGNGSRVEDKEDLKQVWAHLLRRSINLTVLGQQVSQLKGPAYSCRLWHMAGPKASPLAQVLICNSDTAGNVVVLPNGCLVLWDTEEDLRQRMLQLAASCPANRHGPTTIGAVQKVLEGDYLPAESSEPLASESLDFVYEAAGKETRLDKNTGQLHVARVAADPSGEKGALQQAQLELIAISLGLDIAVRLDQLEAKIEEQTVKGWQALEKEVASVEERFAMSVTLKDISNRVFRYERMIHEMRYELNAAGRFLDSPDLLWENPNEERLHDQVVRHFDVKRRTDLLNERLSYSLDFLHTLGEHVRHLYSVRLERMIIILITLELGVGVMGLFTGSSPHSAVCSGI
ncbi:Rmnd1 [Symbiodinium sp. KB8]|nr:Rmnd1 [Symbiodinium sp. KB8]